MSEATTLDAPASNVVAGLAAGDLPDLSLSAALDQLVAEDLKPRFGPQLLDRLRGLLVAQNRLAAEVARTVRECELTQAAEVDGLTSMRSWLVGHGLLAAPEAKRVVGAGRVGERLPVLAGAAAAGVVTPGKMAEAARRLAPARLAAAEEQGHDLGEVDGALALAAATQTHEQFVGVLTRYAAGVDPDGPEPDPTEGRRLWLSRNAEGLAFGGQLEAVAGEKFTAALESLVQADRPKGDLRTRSQQLADALAQLCDNQLAAGSLPTLRTQKPHVVLTLDVEALIAPATGAAAATTGSGQLISAARARWLACDGSISRIVMGPDGVPLELGRDHRVVTLGLRRAVERRDKGCVFAGCGAPTWWCDVHHLIHWLHGGETNLSNSALLCERHHTKVHHGFRVERQPDGRWRTWRPDGTEILIGPRLT
ncbi:DUF222 domain-containing protein [Modestobacter sp. SYSU DS0657]